MVYANGVRAGVHFGAFRPLLAVSIQRGQLLALGAGLVLMVALAALGIWLIRLALRSR